MHLTLTGHSGVSITHGDRQLWIDPGIFSNLAELARANAVLITHHHPDHLAINDLVAREAPVWGPGQVVEQLRASGARSDLLRVLNPGDHEDIAGFEVQTLGGAHAEVYPGLPPVSNNAYLIDGRILHPGDSFPAVPQPDSVEVLLLPIVAPWLRVADAVDYARTYPRASVLPIHDAVLSPEGRELYDTVVGSLVGSGYRRIAPSQPLQID